MESQNSVVVEVHVSNKRRASSNGEAKNLTQIPNVPPAMRVLLAKVILEVGLEGLCVSHFDAKMWLDVLGENPVDCEEKGKRLTAEFNVVRDCVLQFAVKLLKGVKPAIASANTQMMALGLPLFSVDGAPLLFAMMGRWNGGDIDC